MPELTMKTVLDDCLEAVLVVDSLGTIVYANRKACEISGYENGELAGRNFRDMDFFTKNTLVDIDAVFKQNLKGKPTGFGQAELKKKDGTRMWIEFCSNRIKQDGEVFVSAFFHDISEHRKAEKALRDSEEKFRNLFENGKDGVILADARTGVIIDVNPAGCELLGLPRGKIIGRHQSQVHPPEMAEKYKEAFRRHVQEGLVVAEDTVIQRGDGSQVQCEITASVAKFKDKQIIQGVFRDVTERKLMEKALADEATRRRILIEQSRDGIVILDQDGKVYEANRRFAEMLGYSPEEVMKLNVWDWEYQLPPEKVREMIRTVTEDGDHFETRHRRKDGTIYDVEISTNAATFAEQKLIFCVCRDITERNEAVEALRESQEFNTILLEKAPNQVVVINPDTSIRYVNPSWEKLNGWTKEEAVGLKVPYPWWPDDMVEAFTETFPAAMNGEDGKGDVVAKKKNGELYWLNMSWTPVKRDGKLMYLLINSVDITEQKRTEDALKESEEKFSRAFRASPTSVVISRIKDGRLFEVNDTFAKYIGYTREELIGHSTLELRIWESPKDRRAMLRELKEHGRVSNREVNFRLKSGEIRTSLFSAEPINMEGEEYIISGSIDITERKKSESLLKAIADSSPIGVYIAQDGVFRYVNRNLQNALGYSAKELLGTKGQNYILPDDRSAVKKNAIAMLKGKRGKPYGYRTVSKGGDIRYVIETVDSITYDGRRAVLGNLIDITERKQMEDELRGHRDNLEKLVRERTNELSDTNRRLKHELEAREKIEAQLLRAKNEAETANQAKSEFLARTSHEIRTPIHGVMGMIDLVLDSQLKQDQRQYLKMAMASAESLLNIINDILDLSKIEARQTEPEKADFNLRAVFEDTMDTMAVAAFKKGLEFVSRIPGDLPTALVGDEGRLRQILVNLIGNANKFTERGEIVLSVETTAVRDKDVELHFSVRDTGIGIPADKQDIIFEPFQQADGSINRKYGGTGLGLTISQRLITSIGGRIWVESVPKQGSTFHFTARFARQSVISPTDKPIRILPDLHGTPVLLVDDNETSRQVLKELLQGRGFEVTEAGSGAAALRELEKVGKASRSFRLVFIDKNMPEMGGFELARKIMDNPAIPAVVVMMLPPDSISNDFHRCQELGIANYTIKPIRESRLFEAIQQALGLAPESRGESVRVIPAARELHLNVLVAEDNATSQLIARKTLEKMGHTVTIAANGLEATLLVEEHSYDLVLMDAEMPVMNGLEATRYIRRREKDSGRHIPIVAMTAYAMKEDREKCLEVGMDGYLSKPAKTDDINSILGELFRGEAETLPPAVDMDAAMKVFGGDNELMKEAAGIFLEEDYPEQIAIIKDGLSRRDATTVKVAAHSVKGAARSLGGLVLGEVALRLEEAGKNGDLKNAEALVDEMEIEVKRFSDFFREAKSS
jgi:PAS domain S-box-containing protein